MQYDAMRYNLKKKQNEHKNAEMKTLQSRMNSPLHPLALLSIRSWYFELLFLAIRLNIDVFIRRILTKNLYLNLCEEQFLKFYTVL